MLFSLSSVSVMTPVEACSWQTDLRFMATQMEEKHKNLYHSISAHGFSARIAALNARIPSLTRAEVIVEMAKIVAAVGDGPTRDPKIGFHALPVTFTFFGSHLYVRAVQPAQQSLLGIEAGADSIEQGNDVTDEQLKLMRDKGIFFDLTPTVFDGFWTKIHETSVLSARLFAPRLPSLMSDGISGQRRWCSE